MWFYLSLSHKKFVTETVGYLTASSGAATPRADTRTVRLWEMSLLWEKQWHYLERKYSGHVLCLLGKGCLILEGSQAWRPKLWTVLSRAHLSPGPHNLSSDVHL